MKAIQGDQFIRLEEYSLCLVCSKTTVEAYYRDCDRSPNFRIRDPVVIDRINNVNKIKSISRTYRGI